jgi:histidinol-phosphate/aromatic aminotransferase/cobyric acid decarboxylase-like protein
MKSPISKQIFEGLKKKNIIIRYFGDFLRINTGSPYENESFIEAFRNIVEQYSGGRA